MNMSGKKAFLYLPGKGQFPLQGLPVKLFPEETGALDGLGYLSCKAVEETPGVVKEEELPGAGGDDNPQSLPLTSTGAATREAILVRHASPSSSFLRVLLL